MHPSPAFRADDTAQALAFVEANPFAVVVRNGTDGPVAALAPLVLKAGSDTAPRKLVGHVARTNRFWSEAEGTSLQATAVFKGVDAYVSASLYPSKAEHGRVVPTWNYTAVEVRGQLTFEPDPARMRRYIEVLTDRMEQRRDAPWAVSDAPDDYIDRLSAAIVGFDLCLDELTFVRKLSQNKSASDAEGVERGLAASTSATDRKLSGEMRHERSAR